MQIDRKNWKVLADEMEAAIKPLLEKHGLVCSQVTGSYGHTIGHFKLEIQQTAEASNDGKMQDQRDFELLARRFGLEPEWFGVTVPLSPLTSDQTATITGLKPRSSKYPVLGTDEHGRKLKYTAWSIRRAFQMAGYDIPYYWEDNLVESRLVETERPSMPSAS